MTTSSTLWGLLWCFILASSLQGSIIFVAAGDSTQPQDTPSSPTVAVTVQRSAAAAASAAARSSSYVIAHVACFDTLGGASNCEADYKNEGGSIGIGSAAAAAAAATCCRTMTRALRFLCLQLAETNTGQKEGNSSSSLLVNHSLCRSVAADDAAGTSCWEQSCTEHIASVPSYSYLSDQSKDEPVHVPTHMLSTWDKETAADALETGARNNNAEHSLGLVGQQYVWDEMSGGWWHSASSSPFVIAGLDEDEDKDVKSPNQSSSNPIPTRVVSSVSESGGMHRSHNHRLILSLGKIIGSGAREANGNITVLLPLSEGLFMDIDDALQDDGECAVASIDTGRCKAEMMPLPRGVVVDIEQPSFASRQHVLAIQVSFRLQNLHKQGHHLPDIALDFASNLHLRYQAPIVSGSSGERIIQVHVPSTFIGGGHVAVAINGNEGDDAVPYSIEGGQIQPDAIVLEAAAGHDGDYIFVVVATLFASVVGSLVMIRDFSRVSQWV